MGKAIFLQLSLQYIQLDKTSDAADITRVAAFRTSL